MKSYLLPFLFFLFFVAGCKKDEFKTTPFGSLRIINVVAGGTNARLNEIAVDIANNPTTIGQTSSSSFGLSLGNPPIYVFPVGDSLHPYYNSNKAIAVKAGDRFSLFLGGTSAMPAPILLKESFQNYTDSVMGIRFINLSPNSTPVNVTLSTSTIVNEFENIAYKQVGDFKFFPTKQVNTTFTFQVRSAAAPATILSSVDISVTGAVAIPRFKNVTLVFRGIVGGTPAPGITRVNHY